MFPAIKAAWKEWREGVGQAGPLQLKDVIPFSTVSYHHEDFFARNMVYIRGEGAAIAHSGELVSETSALNHSVVWACTRVISECEAMLPLNLMRWSNGERIPMPSDPLYDVLHHEPNEEMSAMEFRETMTARCVLRGNAYARIVRRPGTEQVVAMYSTYATPDRNKSGDLVYVVKESNEQEKTFTVRADKPHDIFHLRGLGFDGLQGCSVVAMARQSIGNALAAEKHAGTFFANGGRMPYTLSLDKPFRTVQDFERFRADWEKVYRDPHKAPILEPGMKYESIGLNLADAQFLETRQFGVPEICRWFLMSPHMVGDLSRATFSNIEHLFLEFLTRTEMAWLVRWEQAIRRCLLTPAQKADGLYAKHNVNALLRGDFESRMKGYSTMLQNAIGSVDDVRALEDMNPLPNKAGKAHHLQLNMQTLPGSGPPTTAEFAAMAKAKAAMQKLSQQSTTEVSRNGNEARQVSS